jgi:16S rRNA (uracil1498-N3)-methyltransferase
MEKNYTIDAGPLSCRRVGAIITFVDDSDGELRGRIVAIGDGSATVRVFDTMAISTESDLDITLIQALPSNEKMAFIIQKATELGVRRIVPCVSSRSAQCTESQGKQDKSHRWTAIAEKAVVQCRRRIVPVVSPVLSFSDALGLDSDPSMARIILYEKEPVARLGDLLATMETPRKAILVCGPEGGFTDEEIGISRKIAFVPVRMGGRIMRCETAALAALSILQHMWGDL